MELTYGQLGGIYEAKREAEFSEARLLDAPESKRERTNRLTRERRARRKSYNKGSKADRLDAYSWCS